MVKKYTALKYSFLTIFCLFFISQTIIAQGAKKPPKIAQGAKKPSTQAVKPSKITVKATIAADMDCLVTINGSGMKWNAKAHTPLPVTLVGGDNSIDAVSTDQKSTFHTTVKANAGETPIIEVSFFDDSKFLDYIKQGNVGMVETALKKNPALAANEDGSLTTSPLEVAIQNSQPDIVLLLMKNGASFTKPDNIFPLHKAALYGSSTKTAKEKVAPNITMVEFFLSKGCKLTDKDDGGNTPLHCAVRGGKLELIKYLIEKGSDVNAKNDFEDTPLKIAQDKGFVTIIDVLKSKGAVDK